MTDKEENTTPAIVKKTPLEWAGSGANSPIYAAANVIYGWSQQAYHYQGEPFMLSKSDYDQAIAVARKYPTVKPYAAAVTPYMKKRLEAK